MALTIYIYSLLLHVSARHGPLSGSIWYWGDHGTVHFVFCALKHVFVFWSFCRIFLSFLSFYIVMYALNEWMNESMRGSAPWPFHRDLQWSIVLSALILYFVVFLNNLFVFGSTKLVSCYIHIWEKSAVPRYRSHTILGNFFW